MKNRAAIFLLSLFTAITCQAAVITATITSKTEAKVTGDETGLVEAVFATTGNYKDRITADNTAQLYLLHLPAGNIDYIAVYMHSNKTGGAGSLSLKLNDVTIGSVADKKFSEWPGQTAFTDEYVPVYFNGNWEIDDDATLMLQVDASANSLYLSKLELSLTEAEARPYTVTLNWNTENGDLQTAITEGSIGAGIILPECALSSFALDGEDWVFTGWARDRVVAKMYNAPSMLHAGKTFYPSRNTNLYAVYRQDGEEVIIMQDTLYRSGEYAIVMRGGDTEYWMAKGGVNNKTLVTVACEVEMQTDKRYRLMANNVPAEARYEVTFIDDKLTLTNLAADAPIGYGSTTLEENDKKWLWMKGLNHSTAMYFAPVVKNDQIEAKLLLPMKKNLGDDMTFQVSTIQLLDNFEYILLFDVTDIPTSGSPTIWTTHPFGWNGLNQITTETKPNKILRNGILLIEKDGIFYDVQGRIYNY